jgi:hypothetical protein
MASTESVAESRSVKSVPGWVKFHYPHRLRSGGGGPPESRKASALPPLPLSPGSWLNAKVLRRSHLTTASEDKMRRHLARGNGEKSAGTENAVFRQSKRKHVQIGQRISGASAGSLMAEKQEV